VPGGSGGEIVRDATEDAPGLVGDDVAVRDDDPLEVGEARPGVELLRERALSSTWRSLTIGGMWGWSPVMPIVFQIQPRIPGRLARSKIRSLRTMVVPLASSTTSAASRSPVPGTLRKRTRGSPSSIDVASTGTISATFSRAPAGATTTIPG